LSLDLVEETAWDARREGEHGARIAARCSGKGHSFARKARPANK
jgi:hypothetical protein